LVLFFKKELLASFSRPGMTAPPLFRLHEGQSHLVVSVPHAGTYLPPHIAARLTAAGRATIDTDWHVDTLYDFVPALDATLIVATHSRIVVDLNRPPDGALLYPGQAETGLCPTETFSGVALYEGAPPDPQEIRQRRERYWQPYHAALEAALHRVRARQGHARLLDAHSIAPRLPRLFGGTLPDLNFGTHDGRACTPALAARVFAAAEGRFSRVMNGRFKGGYITRHYGRPADGIDAVQLELSWSTYMDPPEEGRTPEYDPARAASLREILQRVVAELSRS
jgi:N-formylglutamate deformylase